MLDTRIIFEKIRNIEDTRTRLKVSEIGKVRYNGYVQSILTIEPCEKAGENVLITAGIHGDEPAGFLAAIELLDMLTCKRVRRGVTVIPCINPWGSDHRSRANGVHRDVNRDFNNLKTQEASVIARYLSGREFDLVLDLHEDPRDSQGYYLYCLSKSKTVLEKAERVIQRIRHLGFPVESKMKIFPFQTKNGITPIPYWASYVTKVVHRLAFCHYCRTMGISNNIVVTETPTSIPLKARVELQLLSIQTLAG
jgi:hypothetical protein